jgi:predicted RNase H-like HicB family nuclease
LERESRKIISRLLSEGWVETGVTGSRTTISNTRRSLAKLPCLIPPRTCRGALRIRFMNRPAGRKTDTMRYIAFIHKEPDSCYGVSFPDFPGCVSAGDTLDQALANASEALQGHVQAMEADGEPIPGPRSADEILNDPALAEDRVGAVLSAVHLIRDLGSTTRINLSLDLGLLKAIDDAARARRQTRSAFLASAARRELVE